MKFGLFDLDVHCEIPPFGSSSKAYVYFPLTCLRILFKSDQPCNDGVRWSFDGSDGVMEV